MPIQSCFTTNFKLLYVFSWSSSRRGKVYLCKTCGPKSRTHQKVSESAQHKIVQNILRIVKSAHNITGWFPYAFMMTHQLNVFTTCLQVLCVLIWWWSFISLLYIKCIHASGNAQVKQKTRQCSLLMVLFSYMLQLCFINDKWFLVPVCRNAAKTKIRPFYEMIHSFIWCFKGSISLWNSEQKTKPEKIPCKLKTNN